MNFIHIYNTESLCQSWCFALVLGIEPRVSWFLSKALPTSHTPSYQFHQIPYRRDRQTELRIWLPSVQKQQRPSREENPKLFFQEGLSKTHKLVVEVPRGSADTVPRHGTVRTRRRCLFKNFLAITIKLLSEESLLMNLTGPLSAPSRPSVNSAEGTRKANM